MSRLHFYLLGSPRIERDGSTVEIGRRRAVALAAYLAVTGRSHKRQALAAAFWPEHDGSSGRTDLRRILSLLRKTLGEEQLETKGQTVRLRRNDHLWVDVEHFRGRLALCRAHGCSSTATCPQCLRALAEAVDLHQDDFLARFRFDESPHFDQWQSFHRDELQCELAFALQRLVYGHSNRGAFEEAISYARRWLALDPLHEPAHRALMQLYAQAGYRRNALRQYRECIQALEEGLGEQPSQETGQLYEAIKWDGHLSFPLISGDRHAANGGRDREIKLPAASLPTAQDAFRPPLPGYGGLSRHTGAPAISPHVPTRVGSHFHPPAASFLGRQEELAQISRLLARPDCRLVTLAGLGGMGKTRLARQAALRNTAGFGDGVYFIPLAGTTATGFTAAIANELGLASGNGREAAARLCAHLQGKKTLLVLDGFEHLPGGATSQLAHLLQATTPLKILVTSRERLHLREEWSVGVYGLPFPQELLSDRAESCEAVQLFRQRARQVRPVFSLSQELAWVVRVCQLVEGMPLAIELAASWMDTIPIWTMVQEIERGLDFLKTPLSDTPRHHQSLRTVFDHTWMLLTEDEQKALRRLSVCPGRFRYETAEHIAGTTFPLLSQLIGKSLLRRDDEVRYTLPRLVRQYAAEKLDQVPEEKVAVQKTVTRLGIGIDKLSTEDTSLNSQSPRVG